MPFASAIDSYRLYYERRGEGHPVVAVHGSPGDGSEYAKVVPAIAHKADVIVPDLRGFGRSDKHLDGPPDAFSRDGQVRAVIALMDELRIKKAVLVGYDIGGFVVQTVAARRPDLVGAMVLSPPLPGAGRRILTPEAVQAFFHAALFQTSLVEEVFDGRPEAIRALLGYCLETWSGPGSTVREELVDHLTEMHAAKGTFTAGISWFRHDEGNPITAYAREVTPAREARATTPTTVLWPEHDPLFPTAWSDRLDEFFTDFELRFLPQAGHFAPLEAPQDFAEAILRRIDVARRGAGEPLKPAR
ncbi:MAG: alpha/beta hydrolase [Parafilimonas terrae]|nr:alpha/beta hydrolase [Parafilimonas terrae]